MTEASSAHTHSMHQDSKDTLQAAIGLGSLIFLASLLGIWARPIGYLSTLWLSNALLLGCLLRRPDWFHPGTMVTVFFAYVSADLVTGSRLEVAILLSAANMAGVSAAWFLMHRYDRETILLQRQASVLLLFLGCGVAALVSALIGSPVTSTVFETPLLRSFSMWFSAEWVNLMIILPPLLAWPTQDLPQLKFETTQSKVLPVLSVVALELTSYWLGGPGALVFSLPALLWCALSYRVFTLTLITSALCISKIIAISMGSFSFTPEYFLDTVSFRIGMCMLILGPLAVASAQVARSVLMQKLRHAVDYDFLTDVLTRGALMEQGQRLLDRCVHDGDSAAVLMLDLDHFKRVNDSFGHAGGDHLLRSFSQLISHSLRQQDLVGRMGGEEFAVVLPQIDRQTALQIAERINIATREMQVHYGPDTIEATVSIGLVHVQVMQPQHNLSWMMLEADTALYRAKTQGRDRHEARLL